MKTATYIVAVVGQCNQFSILSSERLLTRNDGLYSEFNWVILTKRKWVNETIEVGPVRMIDMTGNCPLVADNLLNTILLIG